MKRDSKIVLGAIAGTILVVTAAAWIAPAENEYDQRPLVTNAGPAGGKAAFLLLQKLGYRTERSELPLAKLAERDPAKTTIVMANGWGYSNRAEQDALKKFIEAGGHAFGTGYFGMETLPGVYWEDENARADSCETTPEGLSPLAAAGRVRMDAVVMAKGDLLETQVAQRCADGAAVIEYSYGKGEVVWWASSSPLTNKGLHTDANLRLLMATVGDRSRTVVFSEANDEFAPSHSIWSGTDGLPLRALAWQVVLIVVLLLLSFSRRLGPRRALATTPRTSPLEFAYSMGNLYYRGGAGEAAVEEARHRLLQLLEGVCGLSHEVVEAGPEAVAHELRERLNYNAPDLVSLLQRTEDEKGVSPAKALKQVQRMHEISNDLRAAVSRASNVRTEERHRV